jgi:two-component system LytT family response regulator
MLRTVIVDDEPLACDLLRALLAEHEDIQIVAQCHDGQEAVVDLQAKPVDLLFLDVQMPEMSGFDVVEQIGLRNLRRQSSSPHSTNTRYEHSMCRR